MIKCPFYVPTTVCSRGNPFIYARLKIFTAVKIHAQSSGV